MSEEAKQEQAVENTAEEKEVKVPEKFAKIISEIEKMSVLDLSELVKILEKNSEFPPPLLLWQWELCLALLLRLHPRKRKQNLM